MSLTSAATLLPAHRGLYELGQYSFLGVYKGSKGLTFSKFSDKGCGMSAVLIILTLEWFLFMGLAYYLEQVLSSGAGRGARGCVPVSVVRGAVCMCRRLVSAHECWWLDRCAGLASKASAGTLESCHALC